MCRGARILFGEHLGQHAVAQAERRVAKAVQVEALEQFGEDLRAGDDDLGAARTDAGNGFALGQGHFGELARPACGRPWSA